MESYHYGMQAYQQATHTVHHAQQLVVLYHKVAYHLLQAYEAEASHQPAQRFHHLQQALNMIHGLHQGLDADASPQAAPALAQFYQAMDMQLLMLQAKPTKERFECVLSQWQTLCDSWQDVAYHAMHGDKGTI